jgi:hypothetical protein
MPEKSTVGPELVRHSPALVSRTKLKRVSRAVGQAGTYFENQRHRQSRKICRWKLEQARDTIVGQTVGMDGERLKSVKYLRFDW